MKRLIIILLAAAAFTSCGDKKSGGADSGADAPKNVKTPLNVTLTAPFYGDTPTIKITSVTMNFKPDTGKVQFDPSENNEQFVKLEMTVTNTSDGPFVINTSKFYLKGDSTHGEKYPTSFLKGLVKDELKDDEGNLKKGESRSFAVYYTDISNKETVGTLSFMIDGTDWGGKPTKPVVRLKP